MRFRQHLLFFMMVMMPVCCFASQPLIIEGFSCEDIGKLQKGWKARDNDLTEKAQDVYRVACNGDNAYLVAHSKRDAIQIGKEMEIDLKVFPIMRWKWRVDKLCEGADERYKETGDSPAAIYVVFPTWKKWNPVAIKYVWSASNLPKGYRTESPYASETKIVVMRNRSSPLGKWVEEKVNVRNDYMHFWGKELKEVQLIGLMTDSDNTKTEAMAAYDDLVMESE